MQKRRQAPPTHQHERQATNPQLLRLEMPPATEAIGLHAKHVNFSCPKSWQKNLGNAKSGPGAPPRLEKKHEKTIHVWKEDRKKYKKMRRVLKRGVGKAEFVRQTIGPDLMILPWHTYICRPPHMEPERGKSSAIAESINCSEALSFTPQLSLHSWRLTCW